MKSTSTVTGIAAIALALGAAPAFAQRQTSAGPSDVDHRFVGAGLVAGVDDAPHRLRFPDADQPNPIRWTLEANVAQVSHIGVGFELTTLGRATGSYSAACCTIGDEQRETLGLAVIRARAWSTDRFAVDFMGGIGEVFQRRDTTTTLRGVAGSATTVREDRWSPAYAVGVDLPILAVPHFAIAPQFRVRFLERGTLDTPNVTRQSSTTWAVGATARVLW